jgi:hypothetical protein
MRKLKRYDSFVNESGIPNKQFEELQSKVREYVSSIVPNINQPKITIGDDESTEFRRFYASVYGDASKFGKGITVSLNTDFPVGIELVNDDIKHISFVYNLIDIISESEEVDPSNVILNGYNFFDRKHKGQKNGHTGEVEDVISNLEDDMDHCRSIKAFGLGASIQFYFIIKK